MPSSPLYHQRHDCALLTVITCTYSLAYAEMRLILAKVLFNFDMELADKEVDWWAQKAYLLWDKPPLEVYLTPRN